MSPLEYPWFLILSVSKETMISLKLRVSAVSTAVLLFLYPLPGEMILTDPIIFFFIKDFNTWFPIPKVVPIPT